MHPASSALLVPPLIDHAALAPVVADWEAWWEGRLGHALATSWRAMPGASLDAAVRPWMSRPAVSAWSHWQQELVFGDGFFRFRQSRDPAYIDQALDLILHNLAQTQVAGQGYPFLLPGFGPSMLAGCLLGRGEFKDTTIWYGHHEGTWELARIAAAAEGVLESAYVRDAEFAVGRLVERVGGRAILAPPEIGNPVDVLSAVRGNSQLAMDFVDDPEGLERTLGAIDRLYRTLFRRWSDLVEPANRGLSTITMRVLSARRMQMSYCDFSTMIGARHFNRFVKPIIAEDAAMVDGRLVYHLDGVGAMTHVPALCSIPGLRVIQWVQGAGKADSLSPEWDPLYRQIIDAGKLIQLCNATDLDGLRALFRRFPSQHFLAPVSGRTADEVARMVEVCARGG